MKGLKYYQIQHQPIGFPSDAEWESAGHVEGILNAVHCIVIYSQYECKFLAGYSPYIKKLAYDRLCHDSICLIDSENWKLQTEPPRCEVLVSNFTEVGKVNSYFIY